LDTVLKQEMIHLGESMAQTNYCFSINCYQTMLPTVLRKRDQKIVKLKEKEIDDSQLFDIFEGKNWISWEEVENRDLTSEMLKLKKEGKIEVNYLVDDKTNKKVKKVISRKLPIAQLKEI